MSVLIRRPRPCENEFGDVIGRAPPCEFCYDATSDLEACGANGGMKCCYDCGVEIIKALTVMIGQGDGLNDRTAKKRVRDLKAFFGVKPRVRKKTRRG